MDGEKDEPTAAAAVAAMVISDVLVVGGSNGSVSAGRWRFFQLRGMLRQELKKLLQGIEPEGV